MLYLCTKFWQFMGKTIEKKALSTYLPALRKRGALSVGEYSLAVTPMGKVVQEGQVFRTVEGRVFFILEGQVTLLLNLRKQTMTAGQAIVLLPDSLVAYEDVSEDCRFMALSFSTMPAFEMPRESFVLALPEELQRQVQDFFQLLMQMMQSSSSERTIGYLVNGLLSELVSRFATIPKSDTSRSQALFNLFRQELNAAGHERHDIPFYAERLSVTPNHLSAVVQERSGLTVMQWINRALVLEAKVLLRHTDLPIASIAIQLGFADATLFARFFRRETGLTAREYRKA